jgi:hypothetical protein
MGEDLYTFDSVCSAYVYGLIAATQQDERFYNFKKALGIVPNGTLDERTLKILLSDIEGPVFLTAFQTNETINACLLKRANTLQEDAIYDIVFPRVLNFWEIHKYWNGSTGSISYGTIELPRGFNTDGKKWLMHYTMGPYASTLSRTYLYSFEEELERFIGNKVPRREPGKKNNIRT